MCNSAFTTRSKSLRPLQSIWWRVVDVGPALRCAKGELWMARRRKIDLFESGSQARKSEKKQNEVASCCDNWHKERGRPFYWNILAWNKINQRNLPLWLVTVRRERETDLSATRQTRRQFGAIPATLPPPTLSHESFPVAGSVSLSLVKRHTDWHFPQLTRWPVAFSVYLYPVA